MRLDPHNLLAFSPMHRLQWEEVQQRHVILYPEGMVELNQPSAEILQLCDGAHDADSIVEALERKFDETGLKDDIYEFLETALGNGWIRAV